MEIRRGAAAIAVVLLAAGCGTDESSADDGSADASAQLACDHFRNVARDADAGILSREELREKVKEIHDSGRVSDTDGISEGTQALLAAVTQQNDAALGVAVQDLADACEDAGA